ncbi:VWA domain-containing protein [Terriglobus sp. TAA 43]|uniref:VWA domain-containing protein n=1 Tax=Terriglobus sp. TAA 43 TaxID=278961 RepID=UPI0006469FAE|nr:VWA domain-containing protein [Terriglobus sp. TAA 43]
MRFLTLIPVLLVALPALAQEAPVETLHVTSRLVEVSAVVTDKTGEPRTGLTKDDFTLKQDGKEQAIQYFSQGNELPLTFVVMIDTSGSQRTFIDDEQRACDVFFETVLGRPQDRAALIEVNANVLAHSDLTNDPGKLHLALYGLHYDQRAATATRLNDAIYGLSKDLLAKIRGRKAIILISDGGDNGSVTKRADAIAEAQRDNVPIYAVSYSAWNDLPQRGFANSPVRPGGDPGMENLVAWSSATGGHVYRVSAGTTLKHIFGDIAQELRTQYEIGYALPSDTTPKQFHKLELKTKDKSLRVQSRNGFFTNP